MKFSVLLPVYYKDKCEYLELSINSVLNQTVLPDEILILVDGEIGQELKRVLEKFKNKHNIIRVKYFEENRGLGKVLNDGVLLAKYDLIARMDSDDISIEDRFETQLNYFRKNEMVSLVGGNIIEYNADFTKICKERKTPIGYEDIVKYSKYRNPFNHMSVMFKKQDIIEAGNYLDMPLFEDYYLWVRVIQSKKIVNNINKNLVNVRAGNEMISRRNGLNYLKREIFFQKKLLEIGYIGKGVFARNLIFRGLPRLLPNKALMYFYDRVLRS